MRATTLAAISTLVVSVVFAIAAPPFTIAAARGRPDPSAILFTVTFLALILSFASVGALVAGRQPGNPIGWLFCLVGLLGALAIGLGAIGSYTLILPRGSVPGSIWIVWLSHWIFLPELPIAIVWVPLLFPTGRLPSRRWAWAVGLTLVVIVILALQSALARGRRERSPASRIRSRCPPGCPMRSTRPPRPRTWPAH